MPVYTVMIGGHLGEGSAFAQPLEGRVADDKLLGLLKALVQKYLALREAGEPFYATVARTGLESWQSVANQYTIA